MKNGIKYIILALSLAAVLVGAYFGYGFLKNKYEPQQNTAASQEKGTAQDFIVTDADGKSVRLSDFAGKPVVINFWATWCAPCRSELASFDEAAKKYGDKINFLMINLTDGVNDTVSGVKEFVKENGYDFPVYFDTDMSASDTYAVYSIPQTVFIDSGLTVQNEYTGAMSEETLTAFIEQLLK